MGAYKAGRAIGVEPSRPPPPLIDLDNLGAKQGQVFNSQKEEVDFAFNDASKWIGFIMKMEQFRKFVWDKRENDTSVLFADKFDPDRRKTIKFFVERHLYVNSQQIDIQEYYITTKGGIIAWCKLDPRMVVELHKRSAKAKLKEFKTATFIPKIARDRKIAVDKILLDYKKQNSDFRYIVRNGPSDICVLIKRFSEGNYLPFRELSLKALGAISPAKPTTKPSPEDQQSEPESANLDEEFISPSRRGARENYIPRDTIFRNITAILNGFEQEGPTGRF